MNKPAKPLLFPARPGHCSARLRADPEQKRRKPPRSKSAGRVARTKCEKCGTAGLTLVEVLLALVILGAGMIVLVSTTARCLAVARQARHYATARRLLAQVELAHPLTDQERIEPGMEQGGFDAPFHAYRWERSIEEADEEEEDRLFSITTHVFWSDRGGESRETVHTYLHVPHDPAGGVFSRGP